MRANFFVLNMLMCLKDIDATDRFYDGVRKSVGSIYHLRLSKYAYLLLIPRIIHVEYKNIQLSNINSSLFKRAVNRIYLTLNN